MAVMLGAEGRDAEGEFMLARIVQEYPGFFPAYNELAELYVRRRRIDDAIRTLNAGLTACPRAPILLNNLGMCRMLRSEYSQAAAAFQAAAAAAPQDVRFRANLAAALGMLGRYEEGLALYEQVLPESEAHFNLGILCRARQDEARAAREFQRAKDLGYSEENRSVPAASGGR